MEDSERQNLLARAEEVARSGSWEWDIESDRLVWSENLYRIFGEDPKTFTPSPAYVESRTHPDDRARVGRALENARRGGRLGPLDYRIVRPDGTVRHLRALEAVTERTGGSRRLVGSIQDVTDWRRDARQVAAHISVAEALAGWETFESGATDLLRGLAEALDCTAAVLWVPRGEVLVARLLWQSRSNYSDEREEKLRGRQLRRGSGVAGRAWSAVEPAVREGSGGPEGLLAIPAVHGTMVLAVLEFDCEPGALDVNDRLLRSLTGIGYEIGQFLARRSGDLNPSPLTPREIEVLQLAAEGKTARAIAERLVVTPATVTTHLKNIYGKYGVSDRASAVAKALREGLID